MLDSTRPCYIVRPIPHPAMTTATAARKVLVVEDDVNLNQSLQRKFQKAGMQAVGCNDGQQGIDWLEREKFDCVLLDLMMPVKDGFALLVKKKSTPNADTPAFVLTTCGQDEKLDLAYELGARRVFQKSDQSPSQVVETITTEIGA